MVVSRVNEYNVIFIVALDNEILGSLYIYNLSRIKMLNYTVWTYHFIRAHFMVSRIINFSIIILQLTSQYQMENKK